jgi:hypothetical protein
MMMTMAVSLILLMMMTDDDDDDGDGDEEREEDDDDDSITDHDESTDPPRWVADVVAVGRRSSVSVIRERVSPTKWKTQSESEPAGTTSVALFSVVHAVFARDVPPPQTAASPRSW